MLNTLKALVATLLLATPAAAEVVYDEVTGSLTVSGMTTTYQAVAVSRVMTEEVVLTVVLSGNGGSFYSGLTIGRLIKMEGSNVVIPEGTKCISACAVAALAGKKVVVNGELWFHPPYLTSIPTNVTPLQVSQMFGRAYVDMARYFVEIGIPVSFAHDMLVRSDPWTFIVLDDGEQVASLKATEVLWGKAMYQWRLGKLGG